MMQRRNGLCALWPGVVAAVLSACSSLPPLERSVRNADLGAVRSAVESGADVGSGSGCYTPLMLAVGLRHVDIARYLLSKRADVNQRSRECTFEEEYSGVRVRIKHARETAIMFAQNVEMARLLIGEGADVNAVDLNGDTALVKAVRRGLEDVTRFLLEQGARTNLYQSNGLNTLLLTLRYRLKRAPTERDKGLLKLLREKGARDFVMTKAAAERTQADGFMSAYTHGPKNEETTMPETDARSVFRNPAAFDSTAYCAHHRALFHMSEFRWVKTGQNMWEWYILRRAYLAMPRP